jgi:serine/threonine protein kinase
LKKIGKYIVRGLLGKGGMGSVYKVCLPFAERIVALKLLSPHPNLVSLLGPEEIQKRFLSEAALIASLHNPHIVEILDFDFDGDKPFYTMEYHYNDLASLIGESYRANLPSRILGVNKVIHYTRQMLLGLARLYRAGIVHRDIKPGNLLISGEDRIKICDFGFSRLRGERSNRSPHLIIGSPFYTAPEQEQNPDRADHRADIYSAGVIVHRMLTGLLPEEGVCKPSEHHPDADPGWDAFVERALQPDPDRRFTTPDEMLRKLEDLSSAWEKKKETFCRVLPGVPPVNRVEEDRPAGKLRSVPLKLSPRTAPDIFGCDRLMRPVKYSDGSFNSLFEGATVFDSRSGLIWQRSGSDDTLAWADARNYIQDLNGRRFCGYAQWRLPTVEELFSILKSPTLEVQDCLDPAFDGRQKMLWSSDRRTFVSAWYVNMELGFAGFADFTCRFHARAVTEYESILIDEAKAGQKQHTKSTEETRRGTKEDI